MVQKKKILFSAYSLDIGGIETALVNLLNYLYDTNNYDITLILEKKRGILLGELRDGIKTIEYSPSYKKYFSKIINGVKRIKFMLIHKNRYDASFAYATYCKMAVVTAQIASENSSLWVHSSYLDIFKNDKEKYKSFFKELSINNFKNIVFVSNKSKNEFESVMNKSNTVLCNNIIDYKKIEEMSFEKIKELKKTICTFLYVGRLTEDSKRFSRILEVVKLLKKDDLKFRVLVIGNGKDFNRYKEYVIRNQIENYIYFLGEKSNPYPYFKLADALLLVSENEGYPVVFNEAKILQLPIITTDVSDSRKDIEGKFGIVCDQNVESIKNVMKKVIIDGIESVININEKFDVQSYNKEIVKKVEDIINERN